MRTDTFHKLIVDKFKKKVEGECTNIIRREEAHKIMYYNRIPIYLHNDFLEELVDLDLIKLKDKQNIELL